MENNEDLTESSEFILESSEIEVTVIGENDDLLSQENIQENSTEDLVQNEKYESLAINTVEYLDEIVMPKVDIYCMSILITLGIIAGILTSGYLFKKV